MLSGGASSGSMSGERLFSCAAGASGSSQSGMSMSMGQGAPARPCSESVGWPSCAAGGVCMNGSGFMSGRSMSISGPSKRSG